MESNQKGKKDTDVLSVVLTVGLISRLVGFKNAKLAKHVAKNKIYLKLQSALQSQLMVARPWPVQKKLNPPWVTKL